MNLTTWNYIGILLLALDIAFIVCYYYYATVKVYNFKQKISMQHSQTNKAKTFQYIPENIQEEYQYLGHLWIRKKRGEYYLSIPQEMIEQSVTTKYKIVSQSTFHQLRKGEKIHINFADKYHTEAKLGAELTVKNYIATSHQL